MEGAEKQIAWAMEIQKQRIADLQVKLEESEKIQAKRQQKVYLKKINAIKKCIDFITNANSAAVMIGARDVSLAALIQYAEENDNAPSFECALNI